MKPSTRENNFDGLRLLAALQVVFFHAGHHLGVPLDPANPFVALAAAFPGVPVFFVISGFLISLSWERHPNVLSYSRNRALRIFPALWVCLAISIVLATTVGGVNFLRLETLPWLGAQLSIGQFFNPGFLRGYGVGVLNGSLWTIPVELQFYVALPIMYWCFRLLSKRRAADRPIALLALLSLAVQAGYLMMSETGATSTAVKLLGVTVAPYLWMFLLGMLLQRNFDRLSPVLIGKGGWWLAGAAALALVLLPFDVGGTDANPNPIVMALLAVGVVSCAFTVPRLSARMLRGNDISYGVYIYHMVIVNVFVELSAPGTFGMLATVVALTLLAGWFSWRLVERPCLALKRNALHPVAVPDAH